MKPSVLRRTRRRGGPSTARALRGVSPVELLAVLAILGALLAFGIPAVGKMLRRMEGSSTLSGITRVLNSARLASIKGVSLADAVTRPAPVVVMIERGGNGQQLRLWSFVDNNQNYAFDPTGTPPERRLDDVLLGKSFFLWKKNADGTNGTKDQPDSSDTASTSLFSAFLPPTPPSTTGTEMKDRIVFLPGGGIVTSRITARGRPDALAGRGIYVADKDGRNFFRVTIPSDIIAKPVSEKWVDTTNGYSSSGWSWQ
jgi:hypothetical protein